MLGQRHTQGSPHPNCQEGCLGEVEAGLAKIFFSRAGLIVTLPGVGCSKTGGKGVILGGGGGSATGVRGLVGLGGGGFRAAGG